MKSWWCCSAAILLGSLSTLPGFAQAQNANTSAPAGPAQVQTGSVEETYALKAGTFLVAEFIGGLNAKKLKPGDRVRASLTQELIAHGKVVASEESRLMGHVTEATPLLENGESRLGIIFDKLLLKHHRELRFVASIYLLEPPSTRPSRVDRPSQMLPPSLMMPPASSGGSAAGVARSPGSSANRATASTNSANSISGMTPASAPVVVGGTPGTTLGDKNVPGNLPQAQSTTNAPASAGKRPGVYGIKHLVLGPKDSQTPGLVILSKDSTVKLEDGTQVVLMIMGPASIVASK